MAADRQFIPAAFVGLLATMPAATAPLSTRAAWLDSTWQRLRLAVASDHGLEALRLAKAVNGERHQVRQALTGNRAA